jgi:hypothetical protein
VTLSPRALAWHLVCRLYAVGCPVKEASLSRNERIGLKRLQQDKVVELAPVRLDVVMCPYCQQEDGPVTLVDGKMVCHCIECGPVELDDEDKQAWQLKPDWLARKIRAALNLDGSQQAELAKGIVRLGLFDRHPVVIAPKLITLQTCPDLIERARVGRCAEPWFFTPRPLKNVDSQVLGRAAYWWSLEERFALFGGGLSFIPPGAVIEELGSEPPGPTHGPFSADFRWVFLDDAPGDPVLLSDAQAAIFKALWHFRGKPETAEVIMTKAGLDSLKPVDIFKVKTSNKGDPRYERPKLAYDTLVHTRRREGLYWMPCAVVPQKQSAEATSDAS